MPIFLRKENRLPEAGSQNAGNDSDALAIPGVPRAEIDQFVNQSRENPACPYSKCFISSRGDGDCAAGKIRGVPMEGLACPLNLLEMPAQQGHSSWDLI